MCANGRRSIIQNVMKKLAVRGKFFIDYFFYVQRYIIYVIIIGFEYREIRTLVYIACKNE